MMLIIISIIKPIYAQKCLMSKDEVELHSTSPTSHKLPLNRRAFAASYMPGQCNITHVACGHLFIVLVTGVFSHIDFIISFVWAWTHVILMVSSYNYYALHFLDRGIVMTYGSGSFGCLGHSDFEDVAKVMLTKKINLNI